MSTPDHTAQVDWVARFPVQSCLDTYVAGVAGRKLHAFDFIRYQDWRDHWLMLTAQAMPRARLIGGMDVRGPHHKRINPHISWCHTLGRYLPAISGDSHG